MPIKILGQDFKIITEEEGRLQPQLIGSVWCKKGEITLEKDLLADVRNSTILHEILHVIDFKLALNLSEQQVTQLETGLFATLKENNMPLNFPAT